MIAGLIVFMHAEVAMGTPIRCMNTQHQCVFVMCCCCQVLPVWLISVMLAALLTVLTVKLMQRGVKTYQTESKQKRHAPSDRSLLDPLLLADTPALQHMYSTSSTAFVDADFEVSPKLSDSMSDPWLWRQQSQRNLRTPGPPAAAGAAAAAGSSSACEQPAAAADVEAVGMLSAGGESPGSAGSTFDILLPADPPVLLKLLGGEESRRVPCKKIMLLLLLSGWVVASDTLKRQVPCGSLQYWLVVLSVVPAAVAVTLLVRQYLLQKFACRAVAGLEPGNGAYCSCRCLRHSTPSLVHCDWPRTPLHTS